MRHDLEYVSIPNLARRAALAWPDDEAVVDQGQRWSFRDLATHMVSAVKSAIATGVEPGDRVALWAPNCAEWIVAALGIQGAGGIVVPLNTRFKAAEVAHVLSNSAAKQLITVGTFLGVDYVAMLRKGAPDALSGVRVVALNQTADTEVMSWADYLEAGSAVSDVVAHQSIDAVKSEDISDIMYTSGTTGAPKGVPLTHGQSLRVYGWLAGNFTFKHGDRYLVVPPFFHTFGYKCGWMSNLIYGVTTIPQVTFDVVEVFQRIESERVTILLGPPTLFIDMINHPQREQYDLSSLRVTVPSAANVPVELIDQLRDVLKFDVVLTAYGLTEATSTVASSGPSDSPTDIANSVGQPIDDVEVIVVDQEGHEVPVGQDGEVLVRGYNVMSGYWQDPEGTAAVLDPEGWLHTGDIGRFNERRFLKITDRKKDMVIVGGFNVYPAEVERILMTHTSIAHAAVVGVSHPRYGEVTVAFVQPAPGHVTSENEVLQYARANMANFKVPRMVRFMDELPRNASLKVLKQPLREQAKAELG